jgi:hypothetical protein
MTTTTKRATAGEPSRTDNCEQCGKPTSFERRDPKTQPPEGEVCEQCGMWVCPDCTHPIGDPCPQPPEHDAGLGGERQAEPAAREGRDDLRLTYEVYDNKHGLFEGNLLVAVVGECVARSEQARELAQTIKTRVNTHTQLVAALEQAHELVYVGVSDRKMLSQSNLYRVVDTIADALRQAKDGE